MTRAQFTTELESIFGRTDFTSRIHIWLNEVLDLIARSHSFNALKSMYSRDTVADQAWYDLPPRTKSIISIRLIDGTNSWKIKKKITSDKDQDYPNPDDDTTGKSIYYVRFANHIELVPIPDDAYSLEMRINLWATHFSADGDTPDFTRMDSCITAATAWRGYQRLQETKQADSWKGTFVDELKMCIADDLNIDSKDLKLKAEGFNVSVEYTGDKVSNPLVGI